MDRNPEAGDRYAEAWPWRTERCVMCGVVAPFWNVRAGGGCSSRFYARRFCPGCGAEQVDGGRDVKDKRDVRGEAGEDGDIETDLDTDPDPDGEGDGESDPDPDGETDPDSDSDSDAESDAESDGDGVAG